MIVRCIDKRYWDGEGRVLGDCERDGITNSVHVATYEGAVLGTYERNGYHDSDFYAVVWDGEKVTSVEYATTRGWTYHNGADADATDEAKAAASEYIKGLLLSRAIQADEAAAATVEKGRAVKVVKGRKVPIGTEGTVIWIGPNKFGGYYQRNELRIGLKTDDDEVFWTASTNVEVINPDQYRQDEGELAARINTASYSSLVSAYRSATALPGYVVL